MVKYLQAALAFPTGARVAIFTLGQKLRMVRMTLRAFQALARYLAQFPGRKNVMWVCGSFPISFFPETNPRGVPRKEYRNEIRQTADLLTVDQVAVYPISARALVAEETTSSDNYGRPVHDGYSDRAFDQIAMETLARDTGGRPFTTRTT